MSLNRSIEYTKKNVRRSPFQAAAATAVMFLTFFALVLFLSLAVGSQIVLRHYESKPQVIAFFKDGTTQKDIDAIEGLLRQEARVSKTKYISKEEALKIYRERNKNDPALLELVTASILPASLEISTQTPQDLKPVAEILKKEPVVEDVIVPEDVVATLTQATKVIRVIGGGVVLFLSLFAALIVLMVIGFKIRLRRDEIEIMQLLGASGSFIRAPFIMEGVFYAILGAFAAWVLAYIILWYFSPFLQNYLGDLVLLPPNPLFMLSLLGISIFAAIFVGALGAFGAVRRYLQ